MSLTTFDIETTTLTHFKRKASPFCQDNWCVTLGFKGKEDKTVTEHRFGHSKPPSGWLRPVLNGTKILAGFNLKFDLLHALQDADNLEAWMEYVADGGRVWCVQLAEYLLNGMGQKDQMLSLDEVAPRYGGNVKIDEVKALWAAGVQTQDIEPELLSRYLCGGPDENGVFQLGDVENTEKIALQQIARARACGQLNSILLNMGALVFTVEAERNGMFVDKQQGMDQARLLDIEVQKLTEHLANYLPQDLPFDFNWNSIYHKSALIFGGTVNYDAYEYDLADQGVIFKADYDKWWAESGPHSGDGPQLRYPQKDELHYVLESGETVEKECYDNALFAGLSCPAVATFKGGKNAGEFKTKKVKVDDLTKPKGRMARAQFTFPGYTKPEPEWKGAIPGVYSTSSEVIEELACRDIPFLKDYASLMKMAKDLGTYYYSYDEEKGVAKGMLTLVDALGIIHHKLNMCSTVTARLSSSDPNLQNIPKGSNSDIKLVFKSRFGKWITNDYGDMVYVSDGKIIQSDFSSLEVYVQAILTKCRQLIADLKAGLDMHCVKLAAKEGMKYEDVLKLAKGYTNADGVFVGSVKEWDYKRTGAKEYSFQSAFGAGDKAIAKKTGMAIEDVARLRAADEERYPEIIGYYADVTASIKAGRKVLRTLPHPEFPGVMCNIGVSYFRTPDGKLYSYVESPAPGYLVKRGITASFSPTEIRNYVVQGTGGEWAKAAMGLSVRAYYKRRNFGGKGLLVNQVHDAVYTDACNSVAFEAAALLHACMEGASDYMAYAFGWALPLPVPSDTSWGLSMMDEDKIPGLKERAAVLRQELRDEYMGGFTPNYQ